MTRQEALAEAQRRWGPFAFATPKREWRGYRVGVVTGPNTKDTKGYSVVSFDAAFANADRRAK